MALPLGVSTFVSRTAYINFCFSVNRFRSSVFNGMYRGSSTSLTSWARAWFTIDRCHCSLKRSSFKVGNSEGSRLISLLKRSTGEKEEEDDGGFGAKCLEEALGTGGLSVKLGSILNASNSSFVTFDQSSIVFYSLLRWIWKYKRYLRILRSAILR